MFPAYAGMIRGTSLNVLDAYRVPRLRAGMIRDLDAAFNQLRQYALALENPLLLIVSDMHRFRIRTNWTNSVSKTLEFELDDLVDGTVRWGA